MRFGHEEFFRPLSLSRSALLSLAVHATLITALIERNRSVEYVPEELLRQPIFYFPRDRTPAENPQSERIQWVSYGVPSHVATEFLDAPTGQSLAGRAATAPLGQELGEHEDFSVAAAGYAGDTVFSVLEVEEQARRYEWSAAPAYPPELLRDRVEGRVEARYVVDTTGLADMTTFIAVNSTHPQFAASVRAALPQMRFAPARIGNRKVRQLVEQEFSFTIARTASPDSVRPVSRRVP
jgi:outer membrane biosynthesis protein TonB